MSLSDSRSNQKHSLDGEQLYRMLQKLGADVEKLKMLQLDEKQLSGIIEGLTRLRDRKLARFLTSLSSGGTS
jgi:hypothetical protein